MAQNRDNNWLLTEQYHDATRLTARAMLHVRFSANPHGKLPWLFEHFQFPADARILELGCGPGWLWLANRDRIPAGWRIILTDFSPGMLAEAQRNLAQIAHPFAFAVADAQALPFPDDSYDGVIANNMLYHVPDIPATVAEVRRVLKDGGRFYASTLSRENLRELADFMPNRPETFARRLPFNLDNGGELLAAQFQHVTLHRYEDALIVTEAEPLIAYLISMTPASATDVHERIRAGIGQRIQEYFATHRELRLTADAGLFEAW